MVRQTKKQGGVADIERRNSPIPIRQARYREPVYRRLPRYAELFFLNVKREVFSCAA